MDVIVNYFIDALAYRLYSAFESALGVEFLELLQRGQQVAMLRVRGNQL